MFQFVVYISLELIGEPSACTKSAIVRTANRGGSRISEKGGLLINIHEAGEGSGAEPQPPTLFYYIMRTTLHNTALPFVPRRAAVVLRISAIFTLQ